MASAATTPTRSRSQVPLQQLTEDHELPTGANDPDAVLGVWATASRKKYPDAQRRTARCRPRPVAPGLAARQPAHQRGDHPARQEGLLEPPEAVQGLPVREVLPGAGAHRRGQLPVRRARQRRPRSNRADLVAILLTGLNIPDSATVPGGLQFTRTGSTQADMLRVNTGIKPNADGACVFGVTGGGTPEPAGRPRRRPVRLPERPSPPRRRHRHRGPRPPPGLRPDPQRGPRRPEPQPRTT